MDKTKDQSEVTVAMDGYENSDLLCVAELKNYQCWVLDSGCSFHMTPYRELFESFQEVTRGVVILENNKACKFLGIGTVELILDDGTMKTLQEFRYIPELKRNLISLGSPDQNRYTFKNENGKLCISNWV